MNAHENRSLAAEYFCQAFADCGCDLRTSSFFEDGLVLFSWVERDGQGDQGWWLHWLRGVQPLDWFRQIVSTEHPVPANLKKWVTRYRKIEGADPKMGRWLRLEHRSELDTYRHGLALLTKRIVHGWNDRMWIIDELVCFYGLDGAEDIISKLPHPGEKNTPACSPETSPHPDGPAESPDVARERFNAAMRRRGRTGTDRNVGEVR